MTISHVAGHGAKDRSDCQRTVIEKCTIEQTGAGGLYIRATQSLLEANTIRSVGLDFPSAQGIHGGGEGSTIRGNRLDGIPYSGMGLGGKNLLIEANTFSNCMTVLHDGAAIYIFGGKGCIVRGNVVRDISNQGGYGVSAYYLDETCENCVVEGNLAWNIPWPSHNHMARNNTIRGNVFVNDGDMKVTFPRCADYTFEKNVLLAAGKVRFEGVNAVTRWSGNIIRSEKGVYEGTLLKDYGQIGSSALIQGDTSTDDPGFVDWRKGDLRFKPGAKGTALGLTAPTRP